MNFHQKTKKEIYKPSHIVMMSLQKQKSSFDPTDNPFLKASNPFRVPAKFYSPSTYSDKNQSISSYQNLKSSSYHHEKAPTLLKQFHQRETLFKNEKQNMLKMSSLKYRRTPKATQYSFQRQKLFLQDSNIKKNQGLIHKQKLSSQIEGKSSNKFKKCFDQNEVHLFQQKMFQSTSLKSDFVMIDCSIKQKLENHLQKYVAMGISIDSITNKRLQIHSVQNSPVRRTNFPPTFANIDTNRKSSVSSCRERPLNTFSDRKVGLMDQISMSRKDSTEFSMKRQVVKEIKNYAIQVPKKTKQSALKIEKKTSIKTVKIAPPASILIRGNKFFINEVKPQH